MWGWSPKKGSTTYTDSLHKVFTINIDDNTESPTKNYTKIPEMPPITVHTNVVIKLLSDIRTV